MAVHGTFTWNELMTRDVEAARRFYGDCLDWTFQSWEMAEGGIYWVANVGDQAVAGLFDMNDPAFADQRPHWFAYIAVDDVDARVAKALEAGGTLLRPVFEVPGVGRIGLVQDPTGAVVGWMTSTRS